MLKAIALPQVEQRLAGEGYDMQGSSAEEFAALIRSDLVKYAKVIREAGIRID